MLVKYLKYWFPIHCLLFAANPGEISAQISARLDSTIVQTGNPMTLHISAQGQKPRGVDFSPWDNLVPPENRASETDWQDLGGTWVKDMTFVLFDSARLLLPPLTVALENGGEARTRGLTLDVVPTLLVGDQPAEIKTIHRQKGTWFGPWLLAALWLLVAAGTLGWLFWNDRRKPKVVPQTRPLRPDEIALGKLDALRNRQLWQKGDLKTYYSELTFIARQYLEHRFRVPALESTSDEILRDIRKAGFPGELENLLREVLQTADLVKFAKGNPPGDFHEAAWAKTRRLVEATAVEPVSV